MNSISFKNFRKFEYLPNLDIAPITFLVGANNSGKSSILKGTMLCLKNLCSHGRALAANKPAFFYDFKEANVGSFERALNKYAKPCEGDEKTYEMAFSFSVDKVKFDYIIHSPFRTLSTTAPDISKISIDDKLHNVQFVFDFIELTKTVSFNYNKINNAEDIKKKSEEVENLKTTLKTLEDHYQKNTEKINTKNLRQRLDIANGQLKKLEGESKEVQEHADVTIIAKDNLIPNQNVIISLVNSFRYDVSSLQEELDDELQLLREHFKCVECAITHITSIVSQEQSVFIPSHLASQKTLLQPEGSKNFIANVVKEFYRLDVSPRNKLCRQWMDKDHFNIGNGFTIIPVHGEAYQVDLKLDNEKTINLAESGRGAIQLMALLLKFSTIIKTYGESKKNLKPIVILEEPEQNLHPKFQSKLADLFLHLYKEYGIRFLVETHSEYLIRRTQVLVAQMGFKSEKDLNKNPFMVYYFNNSASGDQPFYSMKYRTDGNFSNKFGSGFYDESTKLLFDLL